jgi:predicted PurR-regulated permease PerM
MRRWAHERYQQSNRRALMSSTDPAELASRRYRFAFVLLLTLGALTAYVAVIRTFVLAIVLAAIFSGLLYPLYRKALHWCGDRRALAAGLLIVVALLAIGLPFLGLLGLVASEAVSLTRATKVWLEAQLQHPGAISIQKEGWLQFGGHFETVKAWIVSRMGDIIGGLARLITKNVAAVTQGAISFFLDFFVMLYALFYFLRRGPELRATIIDYIPLSEAESAALIDRTLAVTMATLRSIVVIGVIQGALVGLAFKVVGINGAFLWGTVAAALSTLPGLGASVIWAPAAVYLIVSGQMIEGIGLLVWGLGVISVIDNILRPTLIGKGAALPDLLVLVSTLGGIATLGAAGLLLGPVIAGVMLSTLELYRAVSYSTGLSSAGAQDTGNDKIARPGM